jgi:protein SDA1
MENLVGHQDTSTNFEPISIFETEMGLLKPASWKQYIKQTPEEIMEEQIAFELETKDLFLLVSRVKRDPDGFHEEMIRMVKKFYKEYEDFKRNPTGRNVRLARLSVFLCQVFEYYRGDLKFLVETISNLLETYAG